MDKQFKYGQFLYGGDYNPEQWLDRPDILEKDIIYMKKAHINVVSLAIFAWSILEPKENEYQLEWLAESVDNLYHNGIYTILATPSGARPKWIADKYPEVLRVDETGHRNFFGLRHNHCYTSPVYREKVARINEKLSNRLGEHPGVIMWHISNEYGGACYCQLCQHQFRIWLKNKYHTIEELNDKWCTTFWSHSYQSFEQIEAPSKHGETLLHALNLDWKRFVTDQTMDFAREEIAAVRKNGNSRPVTTNLMYNHDSLNYYKFKDLVDVISWDNYPTWHKDSESLTAMDSAIEHDRMRSIKMQPYLLMESCPSATSWQSVSKLKRPGMLHAASMQAIAHGSDSVQFFQIRQSRGAAEKLHGAIIDHYGGDDTRVFREVEELGADMERISEVQGSQIVSQAAIIYDTENRWALEDADGPRNKNLYYRESVKKSYQGLRRMGINVDIIDMEMQLETYKIVAAPMNYLYRAGFEKKVRKFVARGGIFLTTYWSGIVDENDRCFLNGTPYGLMDVLGLRSTEIDALYDDEENVLCPMPDNRLGISRSYRVKNICDILQVSTADVLMNYEKDFYQGTPAVTCNSYKKGSAYYVAADVEEDFYLDLFEYLVQEAKIEQSYSSILPEGVEITMRQSAHVTYTFVQNFNSHPVTIDLSQYLGKILLGNYDGSVKGYETIVIKK